MKKRRAVKLLRRRPASALVRHEGWACYAEEAASKNPQREINARDLSAAEVQQMRAFLVSGSLRNKLLLHEIGKSSPDRFIRLLSPARLPFRHSGSHRIHIALASQLLTPI